MCGFITSIVSLFIFRACVFFVVIVMLYCLCDVSVVYGPLSQINLNFLIFSRNWNRLRLNIEQPDSGGVHYTCLQYVERSAMIFHA